MVGIATSSAANETTMPQLISWSSLQLDKFLKKETEKAEKIQQTKKCKLKVHLEKLLWIG